jgi:hypothetical protein
MKYRSSALFSCLLSARGSEIFEEFTIKYRKIAKNPVKKTILIILQQNCQNCYLNFGKNFLKTLNCRILNLQNINQKF